MSKIEKPHPPEKKPPTIEDLPKQDILMRKEEIQEVARRKHENLKDKPPETHISRVSTLLHKIACECEQKNLTRREAREILRTLENNQESWKKIIRTQLLQKTEKHADSQSQILLMKGLGMQLHKEDVQNQAYLSRLVSNLKSIQTNPDFADIYQEIRLKKAYNNQKKILESTLGYQLTNIQVEMYTKALQKTYTDINYSSFSQSSKYVGNEGLILYAIFDKHTPTQIRTTFASPKFAQYLQEVQNENLIQIARSEGLIHKSQPFSQVNIFRALAQEELAQGGNWETLEAKIDHLKIDSHLRLGLRGTIKFAEKNDNTYRSLQEYVTQIWYKWDTAQSLISQYNTHLQNIGTTSLVQYTSNPQETSFLSVQPQLREFRTIIWEHQNKSWDEIGKTIQDIYSPQIPEHIRRYFADVRKEYPSAKAYINKKLSKNRVTPLSHTQIRTLQLHTQEDFSLFNAHIRETAQATWVHEVLESDNLSHTEKQNITQILVDSGYKDQIEAYNEKCIQLGLPVLITENTPLKSDIQITYNPDTKEYLAQDDHGAQMYIQPELLENSEKLTETFHIIHKMGLNFFTADELKKVQKVYNDTYQEVEGPKKPDRPLDLSNGVALGVFGEKDALMNFSDFIKSQYSNNQFNLGKHLQSWGEEVSDATFTHADNEIRRALFFDRAVIWFHRDDFREALTKFWMNQEV